MAHRDGAGHNRSAFGEALMPVLRMHEVVQTKREQLLLVTAEQPAQLVIDIQERTVAGVDGHTDRRFLKGAAKSLSRLT